jgi:hypothetical protein
VNVTVTPEGQIIVSSADGEALARMEQLIRNLAPQPPRFKVFEIKNVAAANVWTNLTDYYAAELEEAQYQGPAWAAPARTTQQNSLNRRQDMNILYDVPTNSIIVANASNAQLHEIQQLIDWFDRPTSSEAVSNRRTAVIPLNYSQASVIATAVKEGYRELLSSRGRDLGGGGGGGGRGGGGQSASALAALARDTVIQYGNGPNGVALKQTDPVKLTFDGALSIGVDESANAVIVSAQDDLFDTVVDLIKELDKQAAPTDEKIFVSRLNDVNLSALNNVLGGLGANVTTGMSSAATASGGNQAQNRQQTAQAGQRGGQQAGGGRGGAAGGGGRGAAGGGGGGRGAAGGGGGGRGAAGGGGGGRGGGGGGGGRGGAGGGGGGRGGRG